MQSVDLFGNPDRPGRGLRGRPAFEVTEKDRNKIKLLLALGWSNTRVANALDVSLATLKRHFRAELKARDQMRDRLDARRFEVVADVAWTGNVAALKELGRMIEKSDLMLAERRINDRQTGADQPKERPGKKVVAAREAETAGLGSDWGDDLKFEGRSN